MNAEVMFSSATDEWSTPQEFFDKLDEEFHFETDVCATKENAKCQQYFTREDDALKQNWGGVLLDESPIRKTDLDVGEKGMGIGTERRNSRVPGPSQDGHQVVSRLLLERRDSIHKGQVKIRRMQR